MFQMTRNIFGGLHRAHNRVMTVMLLTPTSTTRWHSTTCPHVSHLTPTPTNILLPPSTSHPPLSTSTPLLCHTCLTPVAPKLCMTCQTMFCGRTAGSHALHHYQDKTDHHISASLDSLDFWCFTCKRVLNDSDANNVVMDVFKKMYKLAHAKDCTFSTMKEALAHTHAFPQVTIKRPSLQLSDLQFTTLHIPFQETTLSRKQLRDKIKGVIYGSCIGDAIGLLTEYMPKQTAIKSYGNKPLEYVILESILHRQGQVDVNDFAHRLVHWAQHGYPELGDTSGAGLGWTVKQVVQHKSFLSSPTLASRSVWEASGKSVAANGAVMRTCILGVPFFHDLPKVVQNTIEICKVTHADPRCIASCVAVTSAIALMLQGKNFDEVIRESERLAKQSLGNDQVVEFEQCMNARSLSELVLDENGKMGYTYKSLGSAFYALKHEKRDFRKAITNITMEGGDADSNAVVAGALLGCLNGFSSLPVEWVEGLNHRQWLDSRVEAFLYTLGL